MRNVPVVGKVIAVLMTLFWIATCLTLIAILSAFIYALMHGYIFIGVVLALCLFTQVLVVSAAYSETETVWEEVMSAED